MPVESPFNCDLNRIDDQCNRWGTLINHITTKALVVSKFRMPDPPFHNLMFNDTVVDIEPNV